MSPQFTKCELEVMRQESTDLLGKRVVLDDLKLPSKNTGLSTRGNIAAAVSRVEVYSHLQPNTPYKAAFDNVEDGEAREAGEAFAFEPRGYPTVSIVLPNQQNAIAVIKELLSHDGDTLSWTRFLERHFNMGPIAFKEFVYAVDGIDISRRNAKFRLQDVPGANVESDLILSPNKKIPNLDSEVRLRQKTRAQLALLLKDLLVAERRP